MNTVRLTDMSGKDKLVHVRKKFSSLSDQLHPQEPFSTRNDKAEKYPDNNMIEDISI